MPLPGTIAKNRFQNALSRRVYSPPSFTVASSSWAWSGNPRRACVDGAHTESGWTALVGDREALSLGVEGTLLLIARVGSWLTRDLGVTWEPALGFNEMDDADVAWQDATHAIVASRHGLFRYEVP